MAGSSLPPRLLRAPQGWAALPLLLALLLSLAALGHCAERLSPGRVLETAEDPFNATSTRVPLSECTDWTPDAVKCTKVTAQGCTWYRAKYYADFYNFTSGMNDSYVAQNITKVDPESKLCPVLNADIFPCARVCVDQEGFLPPHAPNTTVTCMTGCSGDGIARATYSYTPYGNSSKLRGMCETAPWELCRRPRGPFGLPLNISTTPMSECKAACGDKVDLSGFANDTCVKVSDFSCSMYSTASASQLGGAVCVDPETASACPNMTIKEVTRCYPGCGPKRGSKICLPPVCMGGVRKSAFIHSTNSGDQLRFGECNLGSCGGQRSEESEEESTLGAPFALEEETSLADYLDQAIAGSALPLPLNLLPNLPTDLLTNLLKRLPSGLPANLIPLNVSTANMTECEDACGKNLNLTRFNGGMCRKVTAQGCSVYSVSKSGLQRWAVCVDPATASMCPNMSLEAVGKCQPGCGPKGETGDLCLPTVCVSGMQTSAYISVAPSGDQLQFGACVVGFCGDPMPGVGPPSGAPPTLMPPAGGAQSPTSPPETSPPTMAPAVPATSPATAAGPPGVPTPPAPSPDTTPDTPRADAPSSPAGLMGVSSTDAPLNGALSTPTSPPGSPPPTKGATATAVRNAVKWLVLACMVLLL